MILFPADRVDVYKPVEGGTDQFGNATGDLGWQLIASNVKCDIQPLDHLNDGDHQRPSGSSDEAVYTIYMPVRPIVLPKYKLVITRYGSDPAGVGMVGLELGVSDRDYYSKLMSHQKLTASPARVL